VNKLLLITCLLFSQVVFAKVVNPKTVEELKETSVRILNLEMTSGGTGSIFKSFSNASHILTNKHICRLIEQGGIVNYKNKQYLITHYKKFKPHDLCLVRIDVNLDININVSDILAKESSKSIVSGHPSLLPHIVTVGHLSERQDIQLIIGTKRCTEKESKEDPLTCKFFGGIPVIQTLDAQLISNLIKPGNSGSSVFNKDGEIVGVVFAGSGRDFSYGFIVPQIYVIYFIQNAHRFEWVQVGTPVDDEGMSDRVFNYDKCKDVQLEKSEGYQKIKALCKSVSDTLIWSK
jgi:S1-C subfamily serine protease